MGINNGIDAHQIDLNFTKSLENVDAHNVVLNFGDESPVDTSVAADSNNALVSLTLPEPCVKEVTPTYVELHPTNTGSVIKSGTAAWARIYNGAGEVAADLTVGTDISLANTNLALGGTLSVTSIKLRP